MVRVDHRGLGVDVGIKRDVEEIGHEAERELCDDVDDLSVGIPCGPHCIQIGGLDMAARLGDLVGELHCCVGLRIGRMAFAIEIHVLLSQAGKFATDPGVG